MGMGMGSELTTRQMQIVALVAKGNSNKEIARILKISDETVKLHLHAIYERLHVTSRGKLTARYLTEQHDDRGGPLE